MSIFNHDQIAIQNIFETTSAADYRLIIFKHFSMGCDWVGVVLGSEIWN